MQVEGGCFCGALRYQVTARPVVKAQCHCRACQYISGGAPNYFMLIPPDGFAFTAGTPRRFRHPDSARGVTRAFCEICGTHIATRRDGLDGTVLKVGTLDDPRLFGGPKLAIYCEEQADFHIIPEGLPAFDTLPPPAD